MPALNCSKLSILEQEHKESAHLHQDEYDPDPESVSGSGLLIPMTYKIYCDKIFMKIR